MDEELDLIEMQDEDGNIMKFEHLLTFEVDDQFYVAFTPIEKMDEFDVGEVLIMRIKEDDEGDVYLPIETEEELDELWNIFQQLYYEDEEEDGEEE
ncbi:MAG: DUF1292 domain-containing protein [Christensenella sp.]|nr:DUF1292 domain-containing protein [Christensenella sp.]